MEPGGVAASVTQKDLQSEIIISSYLLSNLHCPTCVSHIQEMLSALHPKPVSISPSLVSSWVTVKHDSRLSEKNIQEALEDAGFDVCNVTSEATLGPFSTGYHGRIGYLDRFLHEWDSDKAREAARSRESTTHVRNCESCRLADIKHDSSRKNDSSQDPSSSKLSPIKQDKAMWVPTDSKSEFPLVIIDSVASEDLWRATLAVGGMTCQACVVTLTEELEKKDWVRKVVVNLISNSATVDFVGNQHKDHIVEAIEDVGFDAAVDSVVELKTVRSDTSKNNTSRTVEILVNGMYCEHCPSRVLSVLAAFGKHIQVEKPLSPNDPILKVTYKPQSPDFTIRHILSTISGVDESLSPSIHHPLTLEERSRKIHERERKRILTRVMFTLVVAIPTLIIGIIFMSLVPMSNLGRQFLMRPLHAGISGAQWALFIMATPVYFLCADVFHLRALKELRSMWRPGSTTPLLQRFYRFGSMNMLMSLGTSIAYFSSVAQLIAAGVHPRLELDNNAFYFDSVVFLTLFLLTGRLIEAYSKSKTGDAVTMLGSLRPTEAFLVESRTSINSSTRDKTDNEPKKESWKKVDVDLLELGDVVKVLQGGSPPCDGVIVQGETRFDESSLTGEAKPINKAFGDDAFSGTVNKDSPVSIKITGVAGSSMLDQIVKAVREGQTRRAPMERIADTLTSYFVPFVTMTAICTWIIWLSLGYSGLLPLDYLGSEISGWAAWSIQFAIAVFVVACPCGLGLAAPTALFVGGGLAAKYGILVKGGGEAFEKASRLDCIVFDKTGTLTMGGEPVVTASQLFPLGKKLGYHEIFRSSIWGCSNTEKTVYGMVHTLEENSSHPVAKALASFCQMMEKDDVDAKSVDEIAGKGMRGRFHILTTNEELEMIIGNEHLMEESNVMISPEAQIALGDWKSEGKSIALAAIKGSDHPKTIDEDDDDWQLAGIFAISDPMRPEAPGLIRALHKRGTDVWMLSGDNQITANAIGAQVGIPTSNIIAGVLPSQKAKQIQYLQNSQKARTSNNGTEHKQKRAIIAMVGDGINDSPALTAADVGIAIGSGSDIAISSAEFVLVSSNLNSLLTLLDLSKFVFRRIKFNFAWALVYNLVALPVAAGALYPIVSHGQHVRLDPVWASLAMAMSSISVVCSSLALRSNIPWLGFKIKDVVKA